MSLTTLQILWVILAAAITLFLPGMAWLAWTPRRGQGFFATLADALGLSIALTAIGGLITFITGIHLTGIAVVVIYSILGLVALAGWLRDPPSFHLRWNTVLPTALGLAACAAVVAWRLAQAADLALPAWVDPVHHVLIVRLMLEKGALPGDLFPYLPVPFYYHYGFHALAAIFTFFSGLPLDQAVLLIGQLLNAAISLVLYRLALAVFSVEQAAAVAPAASHSQNMTEGESPAPAIPEQPKTSSPLHFAARAGLAAALLVAFFSQLPAYYLTWGRYTLLAGLILLAITMAEVFSKKPGTRASRLATIAILVGGVLLTHYLVSLLLAMFLIIVALAQLVKDLRLRRISWQDWVPLVGGTMLGFLAATPWLLRVIAFTLPYVKVTADLPVELGGAGYNKDYAGYLWYLAGPVRNYWFLGLAVLGLLFGPAGWLRGSEARQARGLFNVYCFAAWAVLITAFGLPIGLRLFPFRPDHLVILLFFPAAVLAGGTLAAGGEASGAATRVRWSGDILFGLALVLVCLIGARETRSITNPVTIFATRADRQALDWIARNTPPEARFLINAVSWQSATYRGVDGGYWIMPFTGRQTVLPPAVYIWGSPDYVGRINTWAQQVAALKDCSPEFWSLVQDSGATYVYVREGAGSLQASALNACQRLKPIYQVNGISIYQIIP